MPIRRSTVTLGHEQADGRVYVRERHEWDDGAVTEVEYGPIAAAKVDLDEVAQTRAARLVAAQAEEMTRARDEEQLRAKVDAVLGDAIVRGELTKEEAEKVAGYREAEKVVREVGEVTRG